MFLQAKRLSFFFFPIRALHQNYWGLVFLIFGQQQKQLSQQFIYLIFFLCLGVWNSESENFEMTNGKSRIKSLIDLSPKSNFIFFFIYIQ